MTTESIRERLNDAPFIPFTLQLSNGRIFRIDHPEMTAFSSKGRILIIFKRDTDGFDVVDVGLINNLSVDVPPAPKKKRSSPSAR